MCENVRKKPFQKCLIVPRKLFKVTKTGQNTICGSRPASKRAMCWELGQMRIGDRQTARVTIATSARCNTMTNTNTNTPKTQPLTNTKANRIFGKDFSLPQCSCANRTTTWKCRWALSTYRSHHQFRTVV